MKLFWVTAFVFCTVLHFSIAGNTPSKKEDEPKNPITGGVDFAIQSSFVPAHVRQALVVGKAVYEKYLKDSGESPDENEKALESVIGSKLGMGLSLDTVKNAIGNAWELVITSPLISKNNRKALAAGRAAYEKYLENTGPDSGNNTRIFSTQNLEIVEIVADGGVNYAIGSRVVPVVVKGALATGRALQKGWKTFFETRNFTAVRIAIVGSSLESVDNIVRTSPAVALAKAGTGLVKDLYQGKDVKSAITDRGEDVLVSIGGGVAEVAIGTAKGLKSGEIQDALKRGKEMITSETNTKQPEAIEMTPINEMESNDDDDEYIDVETMNLYNFLKSL